MKTTEKLETSYIKILETSLRYGQIQKLERTMELIAQCSGRIAREMNLADDMYGTTITGERLGNQNNSKNIARYLAIKERLKKYYNGQLLKLTAFKYGNQNNSKNIAQYWAVKERLKKYYNGQLLKLTAFKDGK